MLTIYLVSSRNLNCRSVHFTTDLLQINFYFRDKEINSSIFLGTLVPTNVITGKVNATTSAILSCPLAGTKLLYTQQSNTLQLVLFLLVQYQLFKAPDYHIPSHPNRPLPSHCLLQPFLLCPHTGGHGERRTGEACTLSFQVSQKFTSTSCNLIYCI